MTVGVPCPPIILQFTLNNGQLAAGGSVLTQVGGINAATFADIGLTAPLPNPIPLNSRGEISNAQGASCQLFLTPNIVYVFTLFDGPNGTGNQIWSAAYVNGVQLTQAILGLLLYPQTAAESAAGVTPTNYIYPPGHAWRYGADPAGLVDSTTALLSSLLQSYQATGVDPYWPGGTYLVSTIVPTASTHIRTDGYATTLKQQTGFPNTVVFGMQTVSNVEVEPLTVIGRLGSTDTGEFHHAVAVESGCSHITIRGVRGINIQGDVVNVAGTAAAPDYDIWIGEVSGTNVYRNVFSCTGGEGVYVDSIVGTAGVGYRLFDIEPNVASQSPTGVYIRFAQGANAQVSGGSLTGGIGTVYIDTLDLDNNLLANSSPGYTLFPGSSGNIGIIAANLQSLRIGTLKGRNFKERLFTSTTNAQRAWTVIENVDIANCDNTEAVFNTLFYMDASMSVELRGGQIVLAGIAKTIFNSSSTSAFLARNLKISGGCIAANGLNCEFENLAIDATGVTGNLFAAVTKSRFDRVVVTNDGSATLQNLCGTNTWTNSSAAPSVLNASPSAPHVYLDCTFNSITYRLNSIEAAVAYNPGTITAGSRFKTTITMTGAVVGDYCVASFADTPTNADDVTISGKVTVTNIVTVIGINTGGSSAAFGNNTLRACVFKAT